SWPLPAPAPPVGRPPPILTTVGGGSDECRLRRTQMKDRITIEGRDGTFYAHIARPKTLPASAVVVLQELFGVNADIRKTCDELAEQGFVRSEERRVGKEC